MKPHFKSKFSTFALTSFLLSNITLAQANDTCTFRKADPSGWLHSNLSGMDLRPQVATHNNAVVTSAELHGTLFLPKVGGVKPYLAKSSTYDPDNKTLTVEINQQCKWSDGQPVIAEDFLTGARELYGIKDEPLPSLDFIANGLEVQAGKLPFEKLGIKAVGTYQLEYQLNYLPELARHVLSLPPYAPLPTHRIKGKGDYWSLPTTEQIYSGPFQIQSLLPMGLKLSRNKYFCTDFPILVDEVEIFYSEEFSKSGDLSLKGEAEENVDLLGYMGTRLRHALLSGVNIPDKYDLINSAEAAVVYLSLNPATKAFEDRRVREALRLAYDIKQMNKQKLSIIENVSDTFSYRFPGYTPPRFPWPTEPYPQSVKKARELMEAAGYSAENKLPLRFVALARTKSMGTFFQSVYSQIHIDVEVIETESWEAHEKRIANGEFDLRLYYWFADFPDPYNFLEAITQNGFHSLEITESFRALLAEAASSNNYPQRLEKLAEAEQLLIDDAYLLPGGVPVRTWLKKKSSRYDGAIRPVVRDLTAFNC